MTYVIVKRCEREDILSHAGVAEYVRRKFNGNPPADFFVALIPRDDPVLFDIFVADNEQWTPGCSHARIVEVPDGMAWSLKSAVGRPEWVGINP